MIEEKISLRMADGSMTPAVVRRRERDATCWLHLVGKGIDEYSTNTDYFESFADIRRRLARRKIFPLCYASSRNVWPSGMVRDMAQGLAAYKLTIGSSVEERVHIFDSASDIEPVTPEVQRAFSEAWFKSLK
jgi:hypothetical protein